MVSVIVVMVDAAASVRVAPATPHTTGHRGDRLGRAKAIVAIEGEAANRAIADLGQRYLVGSLVLVKVQAIAEPAAVAAASRTSAPVPRFGVAVPPPMPVQVADAST